MPGEVLIESQSWCSAVVSRDPNRAVFPRINREARRGHAWSNLQRRTQARQVEHFLHGVRGDDLQSHTGDACPSLQGRQNTQAASVNPAHPCQVKHDDSLVLLGDNGVIQSPSLFSSNDPARAAQDRCVPTVLAHHTQHGISPTVRYVTVMVMVPFYSDCLSDVS